MTDKVACVMPTGDRPQFLEAAIKCFLAQSFSTSHLYILDDGKSPSSFYVPSDPRIHYFYEHAERRASTGLKRNATANLAKDYSVIVHLDDDDWYHPDHVGNVVSLLERTGKQVVGYHTISYWRESDKKAFKYLDNSLRPHAAGASLCYKRSFWEKHPFTDRDVAEDFLFTVDAMQYKELASEDGTAMLVARIHGANSCHPPFGGRTFPEIPISELPPMFLSTI